MKKTIILMAAVAMTLVATAQSLQRPSQEMMREFRNTVQKRDISKKHLESNIKQAPATKGGTKSTTGMPNTSYWFPGEWEEVQAVVVTPYYIYSSSNPQYQGYYYTADPLVTGWAQVYRYSSSSGWDPINVTGYIAEMQTEGNFAQVAFYLMDAIQKGGAQAWVRVENFSDTTLVLQHLAEMNLRHNNIRFLEAPGNSFWYRDCGPICFYYGENDSVGMLDFEYYPDRALDDSLPVFIERQFGLPNFTTMIEWEGGNCLVDGAGMVLSSDAIYSNNRDTVGQLTWDGENINTLRYSYKPSLSKARVKDSLATLLGTRATYVLPAFKYDGGTGHVDLYADMIDENEFVFSVMPDTYSSWTDYRTGVKNMDSLCSYQSYFGRRYYSSNIPFPSKDNGDAFSSQAQYNNQYTRTYSNHTFVNNLIIQPCFSAVGSDGMPTAAWDRANIEELKKAYPGYTIYCVDVRTFDGSGGAIHCITKQIPAERPIRILHPAIHGSTDNTYTSTDAPIHAEITNVDGIASVKVVYRVDSGAWQEVVLSPNGTSYDATIPTSTFSVNGTAKVEYYISATSNAGKTITKPMTASQGGYFSFYMGNHVGISQVADAEESFGQFYPNPAADQANLNIDLADGASYTVTIVDQSGRTIHTSSLQAAGQIIYTINASRLATGIYNVVFSNDENKVVRRLIVK